MTVMYALPRLRVRVSTRRCLRAFATNSKHQYSINLKGAPVDFHPEVLHALNNKQPVVALETALVTHGLPSPQSLEVPQTLEEIVRSTGAIPATVGIINGRVKIGLEKEELVRLADRSHQPAKISRRDIAAAIASKRDGGTTCSATLIFAALAGIKIFATGGLGGVHRGGETSFDISADLHELTRCPVGLVSSGVKSILDIRRTLEYLETLGVPVIAYSDTKEFPAFFSRHSGCKVPWNINTPTAAAEILLAQQQLGMQNGALIAVPIPESYEADGQKIQEIVNLAIRESEENGVSKSGNDATPWLLGRIKELSGGASLISNIALLENTALVGGQIAVQYQILANAELEKKAQGTTYAPPSNKSAQSRRFPDHDESARTQLPADVVVVGSAALDITAQELLGTQSALAIHSTAPGHVKLSLGGVARNMAEALHRVMSQKYPDLSSVLVAPVGYDAFGHIMVDEMTQIGMRTDGLIRSEKQSAVCNMILDSKGALIGGIADMSIMQTLSGSSIVQHLDLYRPRVVALDANSEPKAIQEIISYCHENQIKVLFEPTSVIKSTAIIPSIMSLRRGVTGSDSRLAFCMPNLLELDQIFEALQSEEYDLTNNERWWQIINSLNLGGEFRADLERLSRLPVSQLDPGKGSLAFLITDGVVQKAVNLLPFFQNLIIKCGDQGVVVAMLLSPKDAAQSLWNTERSNIKDRCILSRGSENEILVIQHFPSLLVDNLINVTGAGDSFVGAFLSSLAHNPDLTSNPSQLQDAIRMAQKAACLTLQSHAAVSPMLSSVDAL